jgi:hypothetical protein
VNIGYVARDVYGTSILSAVGILKHEIPNEKELEEFGKAALADFQNPSYHMYAVAYDLY